MPISQKKINELQALLNKQLGLVYTNEEAQRAGLAIMRFCLAKSWHLNEPPKEDNDNEKN